MNWLLLSAIVPVLLTSRTCVALFTNYRRARRTGLPIVMSPIDPLGPVWMLLHRHLIPLLELLPSNWCRFTRYSYVGWTFEDRQKSQKALGDAFILVNPGKNEVFVSEAGAVDTILSTSKDYQKPTALYQALEIFGPNVDTVEGKDWKRHRKITNMSFNERTHALVWSEALQQAQEMLTIWLANGARGVSSTAKDTTIVTLHVLTRALFGGKSHPFRNELEIQLEDGTMSYRDALSVILKNIVHAVATPHRLLSFPYLPRKFRVLGQAIRAFNTYVAEMIAKERVLISKRDPGANNMISSLIRASEDEEQDTKEGDARRGLADEEILGNVFIFSFAGHETTASSLAYTILLLAAHPEYQEWLSQEINHVLGDRENIETWEYEELFPKLKRCLATMLETVRLYGAVPEIPKYTALDTVNLSIGDQQHTIPPETIIWCNSFAVHSQSRYWGSDPLLWRPTRWLRPASTSEPPSTPEVGSETIQEPLKGAYVPWSAGARVCPGRKFAQVEFVAVIATLFRTARVRPALLGGESPEAARERVLKTVEDSRVVVTLQMMRPERISLIWSRVE